MSAHGLAAPAMSSVRASTIPPEPLSAGPPRHSGEKSCEPDTRLSKIASQVPGMMFQFQQRPDGTRCFPFASDGIRDIFRLEPAAVVDDSQIIWSRIHPDDAERVAASIDASGRTLERWQCEYRASFPEGDVRWHWGTALPERQADGAILWHGFITDVTDRKRAEQEHEESRTLLQTVFSSVDLGVFVVDVTTGGEFRFVEINPAYERLIGVPVAEVRGRCPRQLVPLIPAEMAECLRASFRRGTEAFGPIEYEEPFFVRRRLLWLLTRLAPVRDAAGNVVRLVGRSLDITERKSVELRFQSLTERLQLATEAAQLGIWDHDLTQNRIVWDKRMHALHGLSTLTFDGTFRSWREQVHPDDRDRVERELREATVNRAPFMTSFRICWPDGTVRELRSCAHVQRDPAGRAIRMVGVNWDVTAEHRSRAEIMQARDEAERLNRQLAEALERANELARDAAAATVAKSEFLANMSHEIRTPMNAVIGMSGLLLGTGLTPEQREFAETIRSSGDCLLRLINDILDASRAETGQLALREHPFNTVVAIESALSTVRDVARDAGIEVALEMAHDLPWLHADATRVQQVLTNLLSNAVKFTERGGRVVLAVTLPDDGTLLFTVSDTGIGMTAEQIEIALAPFAQVDARLGRRYEGAGLGLPLTHRILDLHQASLAIDSTPGVGTRVEVSFPAARVRPRLASAGDD